jgi:hypothetical protein
LFLQNVMQDCARKFALYKKCISFIRGCLYFKLLLFDMKTNYQVNDVFLINLFTFKTSNPILNNLKDHTKVASLMFKHVFFHFKHLNYYF